MFARKKEESPDRLGHLRSLTERLPSAPFLNGFAEKGDQAGVVTYDVDGGTALGFALLRTDVDVPYTRWDEITQLKWDIHVEGWERTYKLKPTGTVGRYSVRKDKDRLLKFLKEVKQFVTQGDD